MPSRRTLTPAVREAPAWPVLAVALALVAALTTPAAAERLKVAIVPGIAVNLDAARVDTLSQELAEALRTELEIETIGGLEVRRKLPAKGLPPDCVATRACIDDVARLLDAQQLLFVVMVDTGAGGAVQVDTTWVDVASGKTASRPAIDIASLASAKVQFASAAQQLLPDAPVRPKPEASMSRMSAPVARHLTVPAYVTAGVAVVGLGAGISFGLSARSKYRDCQTLIDDRHIDCDASRKDSIRSADLAADIGWLVAIAGTVATTVLYATSGEKAHVIVEPVSGGAAVTAFGTF